VGPKTEWQFLGAKFPAMLIYACEPHPDQHARSLKEKFPGPLAQVGSWHDLLTIVSEQRVDFIEPT
jgi:hypothetical protein